MTYSLASTVKENGSKFCAFVVVVNNVKEPVRAKKQLNIKIIYYA